MEITRIETILAPEHPQMMWVRVHTYDGLIGLGVTTPRVSSARRMIHDILAPMPLGQLHSTSKATGGAGPAVREGAVAGADTEAGNGMGRAGHAPGLLPNETRFREEACFRCRNGYALGWRMLWLLSCRMGWPSVEVVHREGGEACIGLPLLSSFQLP